MKRMTALLIGATVVVACGQKEHPVSVYVSPTFKSNSAAKTEAVTKIAVLPFLSALHHADDPDEIAPATMAKFFTPALDARADYKFVSSGTVSSAVDMNDWNERYRAFLNEYPRGGQVDKQLLSDLARVLNCDAFLIPVVDLWQKDEVDVQEDSTPATYVGATITVIDARTDVGAVLFRATDEDYEEGARSETGDRSIVRGASGTVRSDFGAKVHRAPPYEDVAVRVAAALAQSLPPR